MIEEIIVKLTQKEYNMLNITPNRSDTIYCPKSTAQP